MDATRTPSAWRQVDVSAAGDVLSGLEDSTTTGRGPHWRSQTGESTLAPNDNHKEVGELLAA
jgi:hypothetical protein